MGGVVVLDIAYPIDMSSSSSPLNEANSSESPDTQTLIEADVRPQTVVRDANHPEMSSSSHSQTTLEASPVEEPVDPRVQVSISGLKGIN